MEPGRCVRKPVQAVRRELGVGLSKWWVGKNYGEQNQQLLVLDKERDVKDNSCLGLR